MANAYEQSRASVAAILGPTGGGKTIAACRKIARVAQMQDPSPRDGVRRARITVVGRTYRDVWDKPMKSYLKVFPESVFGKIKGTKDNPADHHFQMMWPGYGVLDIEVQFRAVRDQDLEEFVRGFETTAWWLPEMDTLPQDLVELASNRVGRYPEPDDRPAEDPNRTPAYAGVFGDANVPDIDSWFYDKFWLAGNRPAHWAMFRQPPGFSPEAENMHNLRKIHPDYYGNMARDMKKWAVKRFIECRPGYSRHGQPVHDNFDEDMHVRKVEVDPYQPVIIGVDGGANTLMPAAAFMQRDMTGAWRVVAEFAPTQQTTIEELGAEIRRILQTKIRRARGAVIVGDPALAQKSSLGGVRFANLLQNEARVDVHLAPSNNPNARRGALKRVLGRIGGFSVSPECPMLIKALAGGFRYRKQDREKGALNPEKNQSSHIAEACEYAVLGGDGVEATETDMLGLNGPYDGGSDAPGVIL